MRGSSVPLSYLSMHFSVFWWTSRMFHIFSCLFRLLIAEKHFSAFFDQNFIWKILWTIQINLRRVAKDVIIETKYEQWPFCVSSITEENVCLIPDGKLILIILIDSKDSYLRYTDNDGNFDFISRIKTKGVK